ncbi:MAG TPA: hypothetical protein VJ865_03925 [Gemmatimonadaceae bacterium]|nr:hypothetical protein [Gemmatimonadaceae bacterium]
MSATSTATSPTTNSSASFRILEMRPDPAGTIMLRSTGFEIVAIQQLAVGHSLLRELDRAGSRSATERAAADAELRSAL